MEIYEVSSLLLQPYLLGKLRHRGVTCDIHNVASSDPQSCVTTVHRRASNDDPFVSVQAFGLALIVVGAIALVSNAAVLHYLCVTVLSKGRFPFRLGQIWRYLQPGLEP